MSRVSVGNLINHTSQSTGGPVGVQPPAQAARPPPPHLPGPRPHVYCFLENGREYYAVNSAIAYPFPCDEDEDESQDYFHILIHDEVFGKTLHFADLTGRSHRPQVLDVGHGTGIWVYEMGEKNPHADIVGIDLHSRTPVRLATDVPNASFLTPVDFQQPVWPFAPDSRDLIRMSRLCGSVPDWSAMYQTITSYLRPGIGYIEHVEFDFTPRPMDPVFPPQANELLQWWQDMQRASHLFGKPIDCPQDIDQVMQRCGLADVTHRTVRVPLRFRDDSERERRISWGFKHVMAQPFEDGRIPRTFEALTMSLFTRQLRMPPQAVADLCNRLRAIILTRGLPIYFNLHVWTARRP